MKLFETTTLDAAAERVASGAAARDAVQGVPPFPHDAFAELEGTGALEPGHDLATQIRIVRAVSRADGSVGRILDGHLNGQERLGSERRDGLVGVWGADPGPGEGAPARFDGDTLVGAKTFCSGAGGVDRALVLVGGELVCVDVTERVTIDESWYRSAGLRASASHLVTFERAPVLARAGHIADQPWFARDAVRTTATWAGLADAAFDAALALLREREPTDLNGLATARMQTAAWTIDLWMEEACRSETPSPAFALHLRDAVSGACRTLLDEALRATGSRPLATAGPLDRAKRDLDVFLLQHRLDPMLARAGRAALQ